MKKFGNVTDKEFLVTVLKRTLIIFVIGLFLNGFPFFKIIDGNVVFKNLMNIRIWGVLQRIAILLWHCKHHDLLFQEKYDYCA